MFFVVLSDLVLKFRAAKKALKSDVFQTLLLSVIPGRTTLDRSSELCHGGVTAPWGCYCSIERASSVQIQERFPLIGSNSSFPLGKEGSSLPQNESVCIVSSVSHFSN